MYMIVIIVLIMAINTYLELKINDIDKQDKKSYRKEDENNTSEEVEEE